ncbi:hypothetical protein BKA61DRAFT_601012 [Leptodontidium sp. MPI-SDFR-AT-0119]|nr:hypothetical protein BKA61DRAFT_601012 [Leptodontidium sp. MPI-SDFR-AT-0119]
MAQASSGASGASGISPSQGSPFSSALTPTSNCVEYDRLVGKIMRDNFWDLDPFTVGLNPGLLNFEKPFIRSKAPHIKTKMRLLSRILARMVDDEHLLLVCTDPNMYRPHPNRSTIDYLVIGDDPPWIPHFFNGSLAYPHVEEAMNSINRFLDSEGASKPPTRVPTVGVSRASSFAIFGFKTEELPSVEEYIDFVHAVVQSGSRAGSTGTIREDHFFPSMAVVPVAEARKRANLVMRLMGRMVEDDVLTRVSAEDGTYVLHPDCRPTDYMADRGLTDISHWVWAFKTWAVLDPVAEKAVMNLEKFLKDISPTGRPTSCHANGINADKQHRRLPKAGPRSQRDKSTNEPTVTPPHLEMNPSPELDPEDSLMDSIEIPDENSTAEIQRRERRAYTDYFQSVPNNRRTILPSIAPFQFDKFHVDYPDDAFEIILEKTVGSHIFQIICHDCDGRRVATKYEGCVSRLELHLKAVIHTSNVMSRLERCGETPIETTETKKRMETLKRADQRGYDHNKRPTLSTTVSKSLANDLRANNNPRGSPSAVEVETLQAIYELPQKAFRYNPTQASMKNGPADQSSGHEPSPPALAGPSRFRPTSPTLSQASLEAFRGETTQRFEALESSNKKKKIKLDHYGTLLGQTNTKYGEMEEEVLALKSGQDKHGTDIKALANILKTGFEPLLEVVKRSRKVPDDVADQLEGLLGRDEQHESRWLEQEKARISLLGAIETLSQGQKDLEDKLGNLETRDHPMNGNEDSASLDARIKELESSKIQFMEAQNELEQEHRVMNARFGLLEQHDESLDEAAQIIIGISSRIEDLETARDHTLAALERHQKTLINRLAVVEQQSLTSTKLVESTSPLNQSIDLLNERCAAQDEHIKALLKKAKKSTAWINYYKDVTISHKSLIDNLENHLASEATSRSAFEERVEKRIEAMLEGNREMEEKMVECMEEMIKGNKEREATMAERIRGLERKQERSVTQLALLKTYAAPRTVPGSENERGGSSTPKGSSRVEHSRSASITSSQMGAAEAPRTTSTPSQMGGNTTGNARMGGVPKGSQLGHRKPRKF